MLGIVFATLLRSNPYTSMDHQGLLCGCDNSRLATTTDSVNLWMLPDLSDRRFLFWVLPGKSGRPRSFCVAACPSGGLFANATSSIADLAVRGCARFERTHHCSASVQASVENYSSNWLDRHFCPYPMKKVFHWCLRAKQAFANVSDANGIAAELAAFGPVMT
jgi:hypothetical protein